MTATARLHPTDALDEFVVPPELEATRPPESRGLRRDEVRLMVSGDEGIRHLRFDELPGELRSGDLLVVNTSATLPAAVVIDPDLVVHFSSRLPGGLHLVEIRRLSGATSLPHDQPGPGPKLLPGGGRIDLLTPYAGGTVPGRLWAARVELGCSLNEYLATWGRPIRYRHTDSPYPLEAYQTVFARWPGSAEMPSAGRPFTERLVTSLVTAGVAVTPLTLHTGVSSLEVGEPPYPEWYDIPEATASRVNHARVTGGRVVAVGTTVVRALETTADKSGVSHPGSGWTELVVRPDNGLRVTDGLITGWHEPASTHLDLLQAVAGRGLLAEAHQSALDHGYLWHEFGDSHLILRG